MVSGRQQMERDDVLLTRVLGPDDVVRTNLPRDTVATLKELFAAFHSFTIASRKGGDGQSDQVLTRQAAHDDEETVESDCRNSSAASMTLTFSLFFLSFLLTVDLVAGMQQRTSPSLEDGEYGSEHGVAGILFLFISLEIQLSLGAVAEAMVGL